jgi:hypothetical protein
MLNAKLFRFARRMQGVRKQKEPGRQIWFGGAENRRLASAVGVAAKKDSACDILMQNSNRVLQPRAIALCIAGKRRAASPLLAER